MQSPPALNLLSPRLQVTGVNGNALSNVIVDELPDGALCFVVGSGLYQLDKASVVALALPNIVATGRGPAAPGRWILMQSASGTFAPLSTILFVDHGTTVPIALQDGSIARPFGTIQAAVDASGAFDQIILGPGEFTENVVVPLGKQPKIQGAGKFYTFMNGNFTIDTDFVELNGITFNDLAVSINSDVYLKSLAVANIALPASSGELDAFDCEITGAITGGDRITLAGTSAAIDPSVSFGGSGTVSSFFASINSPNAEVFLQNTFTNGNLTALELSTVNCRFIKENGTVITLSGTSTGPIFFSKDTAFGSSGTMTVAFTNAREWKLDSTTNYYLRRMIETLTNVTKVITEDYYVEAEATIASGSIAVASSMLVHMLIDNEGGTATDDLVNMTGGRPNQRAILSANLNNQTVVVKNGTGNFRLAGSDFSLDHGDDRIEVEFDGTNWCELSRANNNT